MRNAKVSLFSAEIIRMEEYSVFFLLLLFFLFLKKTKTQKEKMCLSTFQLSCTACGTMLRACFFPLNMWNTENRFMYTV